jgi:hypothetical protein
MRRLQALQCRCGSEQLAFLRGHAQSGGWAVCRRCARVLFIGERLALRRASLAQIEALSEDDHMRLRSLRAYIQRQRSLA